MSFKIRLRRYDKTTDFTETSAWFNGGGLSAGMVPSLGMIVERSGGEKDGEPLAVGWLLIENRVGYIYGAACNPALDADYLPSVLTALFNRLGDEGFEIGLRTVIAQGVPGSCNDLMKKAGFGVPEDEF